MDRRLGGVPEGLARVTRKEGGTRTSRVLLHIHGSESTSSAPLSASAPAAAAVLMGYGRARFAGASVPKKTNDQDKIYQAVFENNRQWVKEMSEKDANFFEKLSQEQNPDFLYVGCSDSRVPANVIMGVAPGNVFVHRNIANLVLHTDLNVQSVIEYAVVHLEVKHVVVCGHYGCGGVRAAMQSADLGVLNPWLREVRDVYRDHQDSLETMDEDLRYRHLVELNVREQCINVIKTSAVQQQWLKKQYPTVHGWVYDLRNGLLKDLNLDFADVLERIRKVYHLDT